LRVKQIKIVDGDVPTDAQISEKTERLGVPFAQMVTLWRTRPILIICAVSIAVRIAFVFAYGASVPPPEWGDDPNYDSIAMRLITAHEYANTWYPPGYPLFLALVYEIFGRRLIVVRLIQVALSAATCALLYRLGTKVFGDRVGRLAGLLIVFYPGLAYMSWRIMAETLFMFLLLLALNVATQMAQRPRLPKAVALGLVGGAAQLVKSNLFVFPALLVVWAALVSRGGARHRLLLSSGLALTLLLVSLVTPGANFVSNGGGAVALPGNAGRTLWLANNPLADGYYIFADKEPAGKAFIASHGFTERVAQADDFERDRLFRNLALLWIRENPRQFLILCLKKLNNAFGFFPRAVTFEGSRTTQVVHLLSYGVIAPFALAGIVLSLRCWRSCSLLYTVLVSYVAMVLIFYGTPRFTVIVMPVLMLFASSAMLKCFDHLKRVFPTSVVGQITV